MSSAADRQGNPVVSMTLTPEEIELVDAYQRARGLTSRSKALGELLRFAFGDNAKNYSMMEDLPVGGHRGEAISHAIAIQGGILEKYRKGGL